MSEQLIVRRDIDFLLWEWLRAESLFEDPRYGDHSRETAQAVLDLSESLAEDLFLPHYKAADQHEAHQDASGVHPYPAIGAALREYAAAGLFGAGFSAELGGIGLPTLICSASFAQFAAANIATSAYAMLTVANARLIAHFGSKAQVDHFARPQIEGRWFGTMCLSEPNAGSSLADIRTRAVAEGEDHLGSRHRLTGNKMWISGGEQDISENIVHLVLAKVPGADGVVPEGTKGISLFIVPKILPDGARNDVAVAGLNHKMGYRGTVNCLLNLGEQGGAVGWLIGEPGAGLRQMFLMMNEARIGVGTGAAALAYRGYRLSLRYAQERQQGRTTGTKGGPQVALIEHTDVKHMLLTQKAYAEGALGLCLYCAALVDQPDDAEASALLALLTPVVKTWPSEFGLAANDIAIQVHGGYGYTRDFDVEQLYRDNRLNPIHEGTTGIQAMDLLGRKILHDGGEGLAALDRRIALCISSASTLGLEMHGQALTDAWHHTHLTLDLLRQRQAPSAFWNATAFLRAFGHAVVAWLWLEQALVAKEALAAGGIDASFYQGKLRACRYFFECELPRVPAWLGPVADCSDVAASASVDIF